jgi:hypothetical protein
VKASKGKGKENDIIGVDNRSKSVHGRWERMTRNPGTSTDGLMAQTTTPMRTSRYCLTSSKKNFLWVNEDDKQSIQSSWSGRKKASGLIANSLRWKQNSNRYEAMTTLAMSC